MPTEFSEMTGERCAHHWRCGEPEVSSEVVRCEGTIDGDGGSSAPSRDRVIATIGDAESIVAYRMPEGRRLDGCCANPCCGDLSEGEGEGRRVRAGGAVDLSRVSLPGARAGGGDGSSTPPVGGAIAKGRRFWDGIAPRTATGAAPTGGGR